MLGHAEKAHAEEKQKLENMVEDCQILRGGIIKELPAMLKEHHSIFSQIQNLESKINNMTSRESTRAPFPESSPAQSLESIAEHVEDNEDAATQPAELAPQSNNSDHAQQVHHQDLTSEDTQGTIGIDEDIIAQTSHQPPDLIPFVEGPNNDFIDIDALGPKQIASEAKNVALALEEGWNSLIGTTSQACKDIKEKIEVSIETSEVIKTGEDWVRTTESYMMTRMTSNTSNEYIIHFMSFNASL